MKLFFSTTSARRDALFTATLLTMGVQYTTAVPKAGAQSSTPNHSATKRVLTGKTARGDWTTDAPGVRRRLAPADLDKPFQTKSVDNGAKIVARPQGAWPKAPAGFRVDEFVTGLKEPRVIVTAPNGDVFVAESGPGGVRVLRDADGDGSIDTGALFAIDLSWPFGLAFYPPGPNPQYLYVANTDSIVRFPYRNGDLQASGPRQMIVKKIPGGGRLRGGGHWTRDIAFSRDGKKMFVSIGSRSDAGDDASEKRRARIFEFKPDGSGERVYATGIRNPVGLAIHPQTGALWTSANERDGLGDHLVPDYVTHVRNGGFYGWPWYYIGSNRDPRHKGKHPELKTKTIVPDVLLQSHSAALDMAFYSGQQFPRGYWNDGFVALHGSWNRSRRTGYKVVRIPLKNGTASGEYEDFLTGFVTASGNVWGRPVGVAVARDGALLVSDDANGTIWRVTYIGTK